MIPEIKLDEETLNLAKTKGWQLDWIQELEKEIPADGNVTIEQAKNLMVKFWATGGNLINMKAGIRNYKNEVDHSKDVMFSQLKANAPMEKDGKVPSDAARVRIAESDPIYQSRCKERDMAVALYEWVEEKLKHIERGHYMCKFLAGDMQGDRNRTPGEELSING